MTNSNSPVTIDVSDSQKKVGAAYAASVDVTKHAEAAVYLIPALPNPPSWFGDIQKDVAAIQDHAKNWMNSICPNAQKVQFDVVTSFSNDLTAIGDQILNMLSTIELQPDQAPTDQQRTEITKMYDSLLDLINGQMSDAASVQSDMGKYHTQLVADHSTLYTDMGVLKLHYHDSDSWVSEINSILSADYLSAQVLSPCTATVAFNSSIEVKIQGTGANLDVIYAVYGQVFAQTLSDNIKESQVALQALQNFWGTVQAKMAAVQSDLKKSQGKDFTDLLKSIDLKIAMDQWAQLALYVQSLASK